MSITPHPKNDLFREQRRKHAWYPLVFGLVTVALGVACLIATDPKRPLFSLDPEFLLLGLAFVLMGAAEMLPIDRRRAGFLRIASIGAFMVFGALLLAAALQGADDVTLSAVIGFSVLLLVAVMVLGTALSFLLEES